MGLWPIPQRLPPQRTCARSRRGSIKPRATNSSSAVGNHLHRVDREAVRPVNAVAHSTPEPKLVKQAQAAAYRDGSPVCPGAGHKVLSLPGPDRAHPFSITARLAACPPPPAIERMLVEA